MVANGPRHHTGQIQHANIFKWARHRISSLVACTRNRNSTAVLLDAQICAPDIFIRYERLRLA
jgi:hypothetical protein